MSTLPTPLRRQLESAIRQARKIATSGARKALEALAVHEPDPYGHMNEGQLDLRRKLRAQAKQLGDGESQAKHGACEIKHLVEKLAYDHWHRLLFARFLLENNLLISPEHDGVSVSLEDCEELAPSLGLKDAWAVAARFAAKELPEIFRADDPAGAVELAVEDRKPLIQFVTGLPMEVFTASDSLGWCYQFWQAERKDEVNESGNKIGADELPAVTQLFTEDYMVDFLLDNTLGAWHAGKVLAAKPITATIAQSEEDLRNIVALPGIEWKYLRFIHKDDKWTLAAGTFEGWPKAAKELTCLDPCMGSGHFVVAMFERLVALRMAEEKLDEAAAIAAVIRENLFGLEIDPRCTQIGAFDLALAAWRRVGHCALPAMNLACSGLAPNAKEEDWLKLAINSEKLRNGMERLYRLFKDAPVLGSLIDPRAAEADLLVASFQELQPLLQKALEKEAKDDAAHEMAVTASGIAKAAEILAGQFTLVATNVPYLGDRKQDKKLKESCQQTYPDSKSDLATVFVERCTELLAEGGFFSGVTPQNWLFQSSYSDFRKHLLRTQSWKFVVWLGEHGFESSQAAGAFTALIGFASRTPQQNETFAAFNNSQENTPAEKAAALETSAPRVLEQKAQMLHPESRILYDDLAVGHLLEEYAEAPQGIITGDMDKWQRCFWEVDVVGQRWQPFLSATTDEKMFAGREGVIDWSTSGDGMIRPRLGNRAIGRRGVAINQMRNLSATIYCGELYDGNVAPIVTANVAHTTALWVYCSSESFIADLRGLDKKVNVTNGTLLKVPFDLAHWQKVANQQYSHGLPKPFSSDATQWLFTGHPKGSDQPLNVTVARLLGYAWPRQTGSNFPDCPALPPDGLEKLADNDGIVSLSASKGEVPGVERVRELLARAWGKEWNAKILGDLLAQVGHPGKTLDDWLRNGFFEQHCVLFHHIPFVWHIWDGHKSGFSALVNYHKLDHANLEKLTYAYLGDWIRRQQAAVDAGEAGSDARLQAARQLQAKLKLILEGEPPYDVFVRWKPLSKQAIGWQPDINDGVRMNIRPFAIADILRKRVKIKWEKDRGKEPVRDKEDFPWFWGWDEEKQDFAGGREFDGNRWNDCHYTNEFKRRARKG